ncbi:MAG: DUF2520 domain-containing protein, partial [Anaerolineae bacterium]|nr:DUF2520 domain-containing protein [Anaerolineae bacterium]
SSPKLSQAPQPLVTAPSSSYLPRLVIVGAGRVGSTLALAAHRAGYPVVAVYNRTPARAQALAQVVGAACCADLDEAIAVGDLVFLAVSDDAIAAVDAAGAGSWRRGMGVVHHSGLHGSGLLRHAAAAGALTGTLHPLQTLADPQTAVDLLPGAYFGLSGHPDLLPLLRDFVLAVGGQPLIIPDAAKPLYHAAAVFASNYVVACFATAVDLLADLGIGRDDAARALLPLIRGAVDNLERRGLPAALTGPIARGDLGTLQAHQQQLSARRPDLLRLYRCLGRATVPVAAAQGHLPAARLAELAAFFADS